MPEPQIIVANRITPARCGELAAELLRAITKLEAWNVSVPAQSRVRRAASHLHQVADSDAYGSTLRELALTARAITLAVDLRQIAAALDPDRPGGVMGQELAHVFRGTLENTTTPRKPAEILSQYWFAVLLARAGLRPRVVPRSSRRSPDFAISVGTLECGVEVKRPNAQTSAIRALDSAADQIRTYSQPGVIAVDLSSCIGADSLTVGHIEADVPARVHARPLVDAMFDELRHHVVQYTRSDKYGKVIVVVAYARMCSWHVSDMSEPYLWLYVRAHTFPRACAGLVSDQAEHVRRALRAGVESFAVPGTLAYGREHVEAAV